MNARRRLPLSGALVAALLATTALKRRPRFRDGRLERKVSTNLDNLRAAPVRALVGSAVVLQDDAWIVPTAAAGLTVGALEYRVGAARAAGIGVAGHVLPTLATQAGVWWGIRRGWLPETERSRSDTGASYIAAAAVGAVAATLRDPARWIVITTAAAAAVADLAASRDVVETGHLLALGVGWLSGVMSRPTYEVDRIPSGRDGR
jgi:hypothetical protein